MIGLIIAIIMGVISIILVCLICAQKPKETGLGAGIFGRADSVTYQKTKKYSMEGRLVRFTTAATVILFICAVLANCGFIN